MIDVLWIVINLAIPTIAAWRWNTPVFRHLRSRIMMLTIAIATGQFALTAITLQTATLVRRSSESPLMPGTAIALVLMLIAIKYCPFRKTVECSGNSTPFSLKKDGSIILVAYLISLAFFSPHLMQLHGDIVVSKVYWDFPYQLSLIQSFSAGGNFPPSNEMMSNSPLLYHYMYFLLMAIYCSGAGVVIGINLVSTLTFTLILTGIAGAAEELFQERFTGAGVWALMLTSSSLFFIDLLLFPQMTVGSFIEQARKNASYIGFTHDRVLTYNGNMFNLFYFLEERQLGVASLMVIFSLVFLSRREKLSSGALATCGALLGSCFTWHLFGTAAVLAATGILACCSQFRKKTLAFLLPMATVLAVQVIWFDLKQAEPFFNGEMFAVPRLNYMFAGDLRVTGNQLPHILSYWGFGLGIKILLLPAGLILIRRRFPEAFAPLASLIIALFLLSNLVLLSPRSIYENHKWVRPMLLLIDLASIIAILNLWRQKTTVARVLSISAFTLCLPSGLIENVGYFLPQRTEVFVSDSSELVTFLRNSTPPGAVVIGESPRDIVYAGRRLYLSEPYSLGGSPRLDLFYALTKKREELVSALYTASSLPTFCEMAKNMEVQFIESSFKSQQLITLSTTPTACLSEALHASNDRTLKLLDIGCACDSFSATH